MLKVYTGGTYDILHAGHVNFFRQVKRLFNDCFLYVALNTDEFIEEFKGKKPVFCYHEREQHLLWTGLVDKVVENVSGSDSKPTILDVAPDVIVIGNDWLSRDYLKQMNFTAQWLTDNNITLVYLPHTDGISTTEIKTRLKKYL